MRGVIFNLFVASKAFYGISILRAEFFIQLQLYKFFELFDNWKWGKLFHFLWKIEKSPGILLKS